MGKLVAAVQAPPAPAPTPSGPITTSGPQLSAREQEVLLLLVKGRSNKEIAGTLFISEETVKSHLKTLFGKLGVRDRTDAAISAIRHGIVHLG